jgi:phage terminase large subunit GpA-like protein
MDDIIPDFKTAEELTREGQYAWAQTFLTGLPVSAFIPTPTVWQEENRYIPPEVSREHYGQYCSADSPHWEEVLDCVHPDNPATHISVIKSVQSGYTTSVVEGAMGFYIAYKLGSIAYFTSSKNVAKIRGSSAIDVLIDNANLAPLLKPMSNRTQRKSADTAMYKEFSGGVRLLLSSYGSIGDMKSNTFELMIPDEWDEAAQEMAGQGDTQGVLEGRGMAVGHFKILFGSTPTPMETSRIHKNFIEGDQRRRFMPCPYCGTMQHLIFKQRKDRHGLTFSRKKNPETGIKELDPKSVRYICKNENCEAGYLADEQARARGEFAGIRESKKLSMNQKGEWRPTWKDTPHRPRSANHRSYHVPGLISSYLTWSKICQRFIDTNMGKDILKLKDFVLNVLGEAWARVESKSSWRDFKNRADDYVLGSAPDGPLVFYAATDVQGDRLETMVLGVGKGLEKWCVDYKIFYGDTANPLDSCWSRLRDFVYSVTYEVEGLGMHITRCAIDSGWDPRLKREKDWDSKSHTVYNFVGKHPGKFIAIRGVAENSTSDVLRAVRVSNAAITKRFDVATHILKEITMLTLDNPPGPNAIHFPRYQQDEGVISGIGDEFFRQFLSENYQEVAPGKMGWKKIHERNEVWDVFQYCTSLLHLDGIVQWPDAAWDKYLDKTRKLAARVKK